MPLFRQTSREIARVSPGRAGRNPRWREVQVRNARGCTRVGNLVIDFNEALGTAPNARALPQIQGTQLLTGLRGPERSGQGRSRRTRESRTRFAA